MSFSLISSRFKGVLSIVGPSSIPVQCFRGKVVFSLQDPIFLVFFGFSKACSS